MRCCWDHHGPPLGSGALGSATSYPQRSITRVFAGDGVADRETPVDFANSTTVVCRSYISVPGYTHTDRLHLSYTPTCVTGFMTPTWQDYQFYVDVVKMRLVAVSPRGGPIAGGTHVTITGSDFGGAALACR